MKSEGLSNRFLKAVVDKKIEEAYAVVETAPSEPKKPEDKASIDV